jgi:hypothetical protein
MADEPPRSPPPPVPLHVHEAPGAPYVVFGARIGQMRAFPAGANRGSVGRRN